MIDDTIKKPGRGGKRPGAGRPAKAPGRQYTIYLDATASARLDGLAAQEGVTPYAWIAQAVKRSLKDTP